MDPSDTKSSRLAVSNDRTTIPSSELLPPGVDDAQVPSRVHHLESDCALSSLSLSGYDSHYHFSYTYTDARHDMVRGFDQGEGIDLASFERPHRHDHYEMMLVVSGTVDMVVEDTTIRYHPGDLCLLNRDTLHHERFRSDFSTCYFSFTQEFTDRLSSQLSAPAALRRGILAFFEQNRRDERRNKDYIDFFRRERSHTPSQAEEIWQAMRHEFLRNEISQPLFVMGYAGRLLELLADPAVYRTQRTRFAGASGMDLTEELLQYMNQRKQHLSREELATALSYNGDYLSRVFKRHMGVSILEYNTRICMKEAARLLSESDMDIRSIVSALGYENRTHFNRLFRSVYQMSPGEYRNAGRK